MKKILAFGDSNTWGYISGSLNGLNFTYHQYAYHQRWTGILERELRSEYMLIEEAFPGRTIMTQDKQMPGASSMEVLKSHLLKKEKPDCVIILLGTNDLKTSYRLSPQKITEHMDEFCQYIHSHSAQDKKINIILVAPPIISLRKLSQEWQVYYEERYIEKDSAQLALCLEELARKKQHQFCDASKPLFSGESDGLHLDQGAHQWLALKLKNIIEKDK